jgi:hypothetical protein
MDFSLSEDQQAIGDLAAKILADKGSHENQRALEKSGAPRFDRELWRAVADAVCSASRARNARRRGPRLPRNRRDPRAGRPPHGADPDLRDGRARGAAARRVRQRGAGAAWLPELATASDRDRRTRRGRAEHRRSATATGSGSPARSCACPRRRSPTSCSFPRRWTARDVLPRRSEGRGVQLDPLATTSGTSESLLTLSGVRVGADAVLGGVGSGAKVRAWLELRATAALCMISLGACEARST